MKRIALFFCVVLLAASLPGVLSAQDKATPQDVYDMVLKAHDVIKNLGAEAFPAFNDPKGEFVFKDSYVFVQECPAFVVAHPFALEQLKGKDLRPIYPFQNTFCEGAKNPNGAWVEYMWPKPGEKDPSRKIAFIISVAGTPYQVAAGIYNDDVTVDELNKSIK
ncbi:MAG: cache domain-containing protein [Pseudomonadota bacterium]